MNLKTKLTRILCIAAAISLAGCGASGDSTNEPAATTSAETTAAEASDETEAAEETDSESIPEETDGEDVSEDEEDVPVEEGNTLLYAPDAVPTTYNIAALKGPTTMGMVKLMSDSEKGETFNTYNVTMHGAADEIVAGVVSGSTDIANVPANLAAVLYNKTGGNVQVCAVNTLGVLYVVSSGEEITSIEDLRGKTVYSTGKGTTPEYVFNYILRQNGLEPQTDVMIEYKTEASECAAVMAESENAIAVLPQPYVTVAMNQNENIKIALNLTEEWDKVSDTPLITGVTLAQNSLTETSENFSSFMTFLNEYQASTEYVNANIDEAAALIGGYDIVPEPVAKKALPYCNIVCLRDRDMVNAVRGYWSVLFDADPTSVGGTLPADSVFFGEGLE